MEGRFFRAKLCWQLSFPFDSPKVFFSVFLETKLRHNKTPVGQKWLCRTNFESFLLVFCFLIPYPYTLSYLQFIEPPHGLLCSLSLPAAGQMYKKKKKCMHDCKTSLCFCGCWIADVDWDRLSVDEAEHDAIKKKSLIGDHSCSDISAPFQPAEGFLLSHLSIGVCVCACATILLAHPRPILQRAPAEVQMKKRKSRETESSSLGSWGRRQ